MGRAKLQIKRIQNMTSRQVTFSKRRNGLIKKAYEISVLCDVDIALLLFSPSGRLSLFSGKTRTEDVLERFVNLRGNERERLQNEELLRMGMHKLRQEHTRSQQQTSSSGSNDPPEKDTRREVLSCKSQLRDLRKQLRVFEGDLSEITSVCEAENVETILQETLRKVLARKQMLQQQCSSSETLAGFLHVRNPNLQVHPHLFSEFYSGKYWGRISSSAVHLTPQPLPPSANSGHLGAAFLPDWSPQAILSQIEAVSSSLDENCVLGSSHPQREDGATPSSSTLLPKGNAITENCIDIFQWSHFFPTTGS